MTFWVCKGPKNMLVQTVWSYLAQKWTYKPFSLSSGFEKTLRLTYDFFSILDSEKKMLKQDFLGVKKAEKHARADSFRIFGLKMNL